MRVGIALDQFFYNDPLLVPYVIRPIYILAQTRPNLFDVVIYKHHE